MPFRKSSGGRQKAASASAGYHYDATPKKVRKTRTPVVAPKPSQAAKGPAGDYVGAEGDFAHSVTSLPKGARKGSRGAASIAAREERKRQRLRKKRVQIRRTREQSKPKKYMGFPTVGEPTLKELKKADKVTENLRINKKGFLLTPKVLNASKELKAARKAAPGGAQHDVGGIQDPAIRKAIIQYGDNVNGVAKRYGLSGEALLSKLVKGESNEDQGAVSSATAKSITQFIPSTREDFVNRLGIDPWKNKNQAVKAATYHLDGRHGYTAGLEGYNPGGGQSYVDYILGQEVGGSIGAGKKLTPRLKKARKAAVEVGLPVKGKSAQGHVTKKQMSRYKAIQKAADFLTKSKVPYVYGGGHGGFEANPTSLDCSSAVSWVLNKVGVLDAPVTSGAMGDYLEPGPGAVTVFYNSGHTFMRIGNEYWGTSAGDSGAGGLGPHPKPSEAYLSEYNVAHVPGLGKQVALKLGLPTTGGGGVAVPGMTLSPSGTTATIDPGAGASKSKAGFSKRPIKLTKVQKQRKKLSKLRGVRANYDTTGDEDIEHSSRLLSDLKEKYGSPAV